LPYIFVIEKLRINGAGVQYRNRAGAQHRVHRPLQRHDRPLDQGSRLPSWLQGSRSHLQHGHWLLWALPVRTGTRAGPLTFGRPPLGSRHGIATTDKLRDLRGVRSLSLTNLSPSGRHRAAFCCALCLHYCVAHRLPAHSRIDSGVVTRSEPGLDAAAFVICRNIEIFFKD
jgi:hypothetical protein